MHLKPLTLVVAVSLVSLSPAMPVFDGLDGAAHAKSEKAGGGNGGGGGGDKGGKSDSKGGKSDSKAGKPAGTEAATKAKKAKPAAASDNDVTKANKPGTGGMAPNELGKMNGALNANINAVLAHVRNGQTTKGPVGVLAGLAVADSLDAQADATVAELKGLDAGYDALEGAVSDAGYGSVEEYLKARAEGTASEDDIAAIDPLIDAVGGTDDTGLAMANDRPTEKDIAEAEAAAAEAEQAKADAEQAIIDEWNKGGDSDALLTALRDKLAPHQAEIDAAVAEATAEEDSAALMPAEDAVVE